MDEPVAETVTSSEGDGDSVGDRAVPPERIGRYQLIKQLGQGGMGVVWQAFDPELKRGVAIKVLLHARESRLAHRLRREAQALARLSHPNVVAVYDVGDDDGEVYVVMQLLGGRTLAEIIAAGPRSARRLTPLFLRAGRGLVAAHAAGIIHRDFKPTNVLVDGDEVRVGDFGLARHAEESPDSDDASSGAETISRGAVGTPAYMSPEQHARETLTPATDQFSFCVALWEALAGERPFAGTGATLRANVLAGARAELPNGVAGRIRRVLARGLAREPQARFASMAELVAALTPPRRIRWVVAGSVLAVMGGLAAVATIAHASDPCVGVAARLDSVWSTPARIQLYGSLGAFAPSVITTLDQTAEHWRAERIDACRATHVRGEQSNAVLAGRNRCLDHALSELRSTIALLSIRPDPELLSRAPALAASIDPSGCEGARITAPARPAEPHTALYDRIAELTVWTRAGRDAEVIEAAKTVSPQVIAAEDPRLTADWFYTLGNSLLGHGNSGEVKDAFRRAAEADTRLGDDAAAADAWTTLASDAAGTGDLAGVDEILAMARGAAARSGDPATEIGLADTEAHIAIQRGDKAASETACRREIAAIERTRTSGSKSLSGLGCLLEQQISFHEYGPAVETARTLVARSTALYGPDHPDLIKSVRMLASALSLHGDTREARPIWERVLALTAKLYGADSGAMITALRDRAMTETPFGQTSTPEALAAIRRAAQLADRILPAGDPQLADIYEVLGYVETAHGHSAEALAALERSVAASEKLDNPRRLARALINLGDAYRTAHACDKALPRFRRAAKVIAESAALPEYAAAIDSQIAGCLAQAKDLPAASKSFESAIAGYDRLGEVMEAAQVRQNYAEVLAAAGDRAKAIEVARKAIVQLADQPPPADKLSSDLQAWIKKIAP